jgi:dipeptidyl aminopeptidase/acylaminoacyl peptidase
MLKLLIVLFSFYTLNAEVLDSKKLLEFKKISDFHISPNGLNSVTVVSKSNIEDNNSKSHLYLINNKTKEIKQFTSSGSHNGSAVWDSKSENIYFISDRNDESQVWKININGGEATQITKFKDGVSSFKLSPDEKYLSFTREVEIGKTIEQEYNDNEFKLDKIDAKVYDDLMLRHWDHYEDNKWSHIYIMDLKSGDTTDIMVNEEFDSPMSPFGGREQYNWSADSKSIAYTCKKVENYAQSTNSDIYLYDIASKKTKNITEGLVGYEMDPIFSPDGKYIAFHSMERASYEADKTRIMLYDIATKKIKEITDKLDQPVSKTIWKSNNELVFMAPDGKGTNQIYVIELNGIYRLITSGVEDNGLRGLSLADDGNTLIYSKENYSTAPEIYSLNIKAKLETKLTSLNDEFAATLDKCTYEAKWIDASDGKKIHTWITYPPNFDKNKKYPMLVYCQGGPQQQISQYFSYGWSMWLFASKGYIVVAPNRRGCPGFGQDWTDAINQDWGGMPADDIMQAAKEIASKSYVDNSKIAAVGASAGGYMAFWLAGQQSEFFNAFVSHCGVFNLYSMYGSTEELFFPNFDYGGAYWENEEFYKKNSPHNFVRNWKKPILIITGEKDYRVPYTQSLEAFTAARAQGVPARILVYPNENHWVLHPQEQVLWYEEFFRFLKDYNIK